MEAAGVLFKADFYGRAAVLFLIRDASGSPVAVEGRFLSPGTGPKAICKGPKSKGAFATPAALESGAVTLVEAPIDALTLAALGLPAIATMGAENLPKWLPRRLAFRDVLLAQDADQAGDEAAERIAAELQAFGGRCSRLRPNQAKDWNELLQIRGEEAVREALLRARDFDPLQVYDPVPPDLFADPEYDPFADE
jgi:DNA primase